MPFKKPVLILFAVALSMLINSVSNAQTASLANNTNEKDRIKSLIYKNYLGKYDRLFYFTTSGYWSSDRAYFRCYGFKDSICEKLVISFKRKRDRSWSKPSLKNTRCDPATVKKLLAFFDEYDFWKLNRDSLNHQFQKQADGKILRYSISDADDNEFGSMSDQGYLKISAYEPEYFLEKMPEIKQRAVFIKCREEFFKIWKGQ